MTLRARTLPRHYDWPAEYSALSERDRRKPLTPAELERLAMAAYLVGHESESIDILSRAHSLALQQGDQRFAARLASWIAFTFIGIGEITRAGGWAARARRLLGEDHPDCAESGFVLLPQAIEQIASGNLAAAEASFEAAERIGERCANADLTSLARQGRGRALIGLGRVAEGVELLDEVMVSVTSGELMPIISGVVYCSVISACFDLFDIRRAQEWTEALNDWCRAQPGIVPYRGECLVNRAQILRLRGRWQESFDEAQKAYDAHSALKGPGQGAAAYALAELHRLRGEHEEAEAGYRLASEHGRSPHPGLALLRLAQGQNEAARATVARVLAERLRERQRAEMLRAAVDVFLACGDAAAARHAADELQRIASTLDSSWLRAIAATADGAVHLASGDARQAVTPLAEALAFWRQLDAPYEAAQAGLLAGRACLALGDADGARLEWETAVRAFRECGAAPALRQAEALLRERPGKDGGFPGGLTAREVEVLRLMARGKTNRTIAQELAISEKTVARHISNIFGKLGVSSRAAAVAYAFTHQLVT